MPETNNNSGKTVNSQIIDAIKQVNGFLKDSSFSLDSISNQITTQAASIAMMNIVQQQQQLHTLQNAVTAAAAKAMLNSSPQEAIQLMNDVIKENNVTNSLKDLKELIDGLKSTETK
ncbi:hypothetical protein [uncultured Polaribacter sp.]|uniref:hypothetical protein n=1 Tax=uncultured Polaribacter sp. TaxID=174711 RepID=UPI002609404C|nr:hypothetical protein [uncultured Polaribacter sp.]